MGISHNYEIFYRYDVSLILTSCKVHYFYVLGSNKTSVPLYLEKKNFLIEEKSDWNYGKETKAELVISLTTRVGWTMPPLSGISDVAGEAGLHHHNIWSGVMSISAWPWLSPEGVCQRRGSSAAPLSPLYSFCWTLELFQSRLSSIGQQEGKGKKRRCQKEKEKHCSPRAIWLFLAGSNTCNIITHWATVLWKSGTKWMLLTQKQTATVV